MGTVAKAGAKLPIAPEGTHIARCIWVIDLGHQKSEFMGKTKVLPKILMCFELLGEEKMEDGRPFTLSRRFTLSLGDKSALRPVLESWRGRKFTREELDGFDVRNCCGKYAMVTVTHDVDGEKEYANIASVAAIPKGLTLPDGVNDTITYVIEEGERPNIVGLPEWVGKIIQQCEEMKGIDADEPKKKPGNFDDMKDDIPF